MKKMVLILICLFSMVLGCSGSDNKQVAIRKYTKAIKVNPNDAVAYKNRGDVYRDKGQNDEAILDYNRAIEINPNYAKVYNNRGNVYKSKGNLDQAILDYTKAIEIDPSLSVTYRNRGDIYRSQEKNGDAMLDYTRAIEIDHKCDAAYNGRGIIYKRNNNLDQAISDFTKAIEFMPNNAGYYLNRGCAYCLKNQVSEGIYDFTKAIEINPKNVDAYYYRAGAYSYIKESKKAKDDWRKAEKLGLKLPPEIVKFLDQSVKQVHIVRHFNKELGIMTLLNPITKQGVIPKVVFLMDISTDPNLNIGPRGEEILKILIAKGWLEEITSNEDSRKDIVLLKKDINVIRGELSEMFPEEASKILAMFEKYQKIDWFVPKEDVLYKLEGVEIKEILKDGYVIAVKPSFRDPHIIVDYDLGFLYKVYKGDEQKNWSETSDITPYWAYWVSTYQYQGKNILAFRIHPDKTGYDSQITDPSKLRHSGY